MGRCVYLALLFLFSMSISSSVHSQLIETERILEYAKRSYTWPPETFLPNTPGWSALMKDRFEQISEMDDATKRYQAYMFTVHAALLVCDN
jgi:hypothetical protein